MPNEPCTVFPSKEAASRIQVEYEVLKPVFDIDEAIAPGAPILHDHMRAKGMPPLPEGETNLAMRMVLQGGDTEHAHVLAHRGDLPGMDGWGVGVSRSDRPPRAIPTPLHWIRETE